VLASGTRFAGYVLYVQDDRPVYEYVYSDATRHTLRADIPLPRGRRVTLGYDFQRTAPRRGRGTLSIDGQAVGSVDIPRTWPVHGASGGVLCGRDGGVRVSDAYASPFRFTGTIHRVIIELGEDGQTDRAGEARAALAEE
jgi:arylsulfatase